MTQIQTYAPTIEGCDSVRKANERILTRYVSEIFRPFYSKIFGATIKPGESCVESAEAEELKILFNELHSYRAELKDGLDQVRIRSNELGIFPVPLWALNRLRDLRAQSVEVERLALAQLAKRKLNAKTEHAYQLLVADKKKKNKASKAELHSMHQENQKRYEFLKRTTFYQLVAERIGSDLFADLMGQAAGIAERQHFSELNQGQAQ
jgi:hypothetical protein